jgi:hypothetical protein
MSKAAERCTFCVTGTAETRDHIPPRCFFAEKVPSVPARITVPSCRECHHESQRTDGTIRNLLISVRDTESASIVKKHLAHKRDKSFALDRMEFSRLLAITCRVDVTSPGGIFLREDFAFNSDTPVMHSFVERMCRGLVRAEFGLEYFEANVGWRLNVEQPNIVYQGMAKFGRLRALHGVFIYAITRPKEDEPIWVIMKFYRRLEIFARIKPASRLTLDSQSLAK